MRQGFSDINSVHWVSRPGKTNLQQCSFLVTQCKRPGKQTKGREWEKAVEQLRRYLKGMQRHSTWAHKTYGIVAIGEWAKFFEWSPAHKDLLQLGKDTPYHIIQEAEDVVEILEYLKSDHQ
jgi:hypothetical protein